MDKIAANEDAATDPPAKPSKNDSHAWILCDGQTKSPTKVTTMKDSFTPQHIDSPRMGRRQRLIRDTLLREAEQEILAEHSKPPVVEEYLTTYDDEHCPKIPGFTPQTEIKKNPEMYDKYPLYASPGMSYWQFTVHRNSGNPVFVPGMTKTIDISHPFKRNSNFSTPITELTSGHDLL